MCRDGQRRWLAGGRWRWWLLLTSASRPLFLITRGRWRRSRSARAAAAVAAAPACGGSRRCCRRCRCGRGRRCCPGEWGVGAAIAAVEVGACCRRGRGRCVLSPAVARYRRCRRCRRGRGRRCCRGERGVWCCYRCCRPLSPLSPVAAGGALVGAGRRLLSRVSRRAVEGWEGGGVGSQSGGGALLVGFPQSPIH